jgi:hypothetical protein
MWSVTTMLATQAPTTTSTTPSTSTTPTTWTVIALPPLHRPHRPPEQHGLISYLHGTDHHDLHLDVPVTEHHRADHRSSDQHDIDDLAGYQNDADTSPRTSATPSS